MDNLFRRVATSSRSRISDFIGSDAGIFMLALMNGTLFRRFHSFMLINSRPVECFYFMGDFSD